MSQSPGHRDTRPCGVRALTQDLVVGSWSAGGTPLKCAKLSHPTVTKCLTLPHARQRRAAEGRGQGAAPGRGRTPGHGPLQSLPLVGPVPRTSHQRLRKRRMSGAQDEYCNAPWLAWERENSHLRGLPELRFSFLGSIRAAKRRGNHTRVFGSIPRPRLLRKGGVRIFGLGSIETQKSGSIRPGKNKGGFPPKTEKLVPSRALPF